MLRPYPAIVLRRLVDETPESFQDRKDRCRNAVVSAGWPGPEEHEGNIYDESRIETEVLPHLADFPCIYAYEAGDLADTRDEFASRFRAIEDAGSKLVLVADNVDLRGGTAESDTVIRAFKAWLSLDDSAAGGEQEDPQDADTGPAAAPKEMTPQLHILASEHYHAHGTGNLAGFKKASGLSNSRAKAVLAWIEDGNLMTLPQPDAGQSDADESGEKAE